MTRENIKDTLSKMSEASIHSDIVSAEAILPDIVEACKSEGMDNELGKALYLLGVVRYVQNRRDESKSIFEQASEIGLQVGDDDMQLNAVNALGILALERSEFQAALKNFREVAEFCRAKSDYDGLVIALCNVKATLKRLGKLVGDNTNEEIVKILSNVRSRKARAAALIAIASSAADTGDYATSLPFFKEAAQIAEEDGNIVCWSRSLQGIADAYRGSGKMEEAKESFLRALQLTVDHKLSGEEGVVRMQLAKVYYELSNFPLARKEAELASAILEKYEGSFQQCRIVIAACDVSEGNPDAALEILLLIEERARTMGDSFILVSIYSTIAKAYRKKGEIDLMFEYKEKERHAIVEELNADVRRVRSQTETLLSEEQSRYNSEIEQMRLKALEQELSNTTLQLIAQTELLSELRNDLLKVIRKFPMPDGAARELRERLKTLPCKSVDWERFDTQFKAAHPEFTKTLLTKCPDLTAAEVRICSLLRMNLRSAEIGRLLCLSERSIEGHRTHIRKKMSVPHGEDLMLHLAKM